jgi:HK97 gp10 family phage protein
MPDKTIEVEGLSDLEDALAELPKATAKNTIRRALTAAAQPIIRTASALIRVRRIKPSIIVSKIKFSTGNAGKRAFAEAMARGASRAEAGEAAHAANAGGDDDPSITSGVASVGPTRAAFYGFEFGTIHLPPKPFMRPAWDQHQMEALNIIKTELKDQIDKAVARIARKQARLIAKIK